MHQRHQRQNYQGMVPVTLNGRDGQKTKALVDPSTLQWTTHTGKGANCIKTAPLGDGTVIVSTNRKNGGFIQADAAELQAFAAAVVNGDIAGIGSIA